MSHVFLSTDLIIEVLSFLNVKSLMRFKCVTKFCNTLISDPTFVKLHLQRSPKTKHIARTKPCRGKGFSVETVPLNHLIENPSITVPINPNNRLKINDCTHIDIVGSCNGLLCLVCYSSAIRNIRFHIWNPATKTISKRLGSRPIELTRNTFVYDDSTRTYKVVVLSSTIVKILNLGDNSWRTISRLHPYEHVIYSSRLNEGVYLSGTVNWFGIRNMRYSRWSACHNNDITVDQLVIISLDLGTETYMQLSPPRIVEVPYVEPTIAVLMDCLCFSHDVKGTDFVIWKMTEYGIEQSWTQFLKISFQNLQVDKFIHRGGICQLYPLCLSENGHTLILKNSGKNQLILYNLRDNRVEQTTDKHITWCFAKNYVESLASIC